MTDIEQQPYHDASNSRMEWNDAEGQLLGDTTTDEGAATYAEGGAEVLNGQGGTGEDESSPTAHIEKEVRELRKDTFSEAAMRLEQYLNNMKEATKKMLSEIDFYLKESEKVTIDYIQCQYNQQKEASRLEECEPGVSEATQRFLQNMANGQWK